MKMTNEIQKAEKVLGDLIDDYIADIIEGCPGDEMLWYSGALTALALALSRIRKLK